MLITFLVLVFDLLLGSPIALSPLSILDSLGRKRFGAVSGLVGLAMTADPTLGPLVAGLETHRITNSPPLIGR
jgi:hypothetical protein